MNHYLVIYDRSKGAVVRRQSYTGSDEALRARFAAEDEFRSNPDIEVVVLGASSWQALERTHSRYFKSLAQLTAMIGKSQTA
jgi:hypothetical protein